MTKLVIVITGGALESVYSNEPIEYVLVDHDNLDQEDPEFTLTANESDLVCDGPGGLAELFERSKGSREKRIGKLLKTMPGFGLGLDSEEDIIQNISSRFSRKLRQWLTVKELDTVNKRNKKPEYKGCCATHDFCDPNEAMLQAFKTVMRRNLNFQSEQDGALIDKAWTLSRQKQFKN